MEIYRSVKLFVLDQISMPLGQLSVLVLDHLSAEAEPKLMQLYENNLNMLQKVNLFLYLLQNIFHHDTHTCWFP